MAFPAPTGRELAIEALLDREPHGDAYRVLRVLVSVQCPLRMHRFYHRIDPFSLFLLLAVVDFCVKRRKWYPWLCITDQIE